LSKQVNDILGEIPGLKKKDKVNKNTSTSTSKNKINNDSESKKDSTGNKLVLESERKEEKVYRGFYFEQKQIDAIDRLARITGKDKSEIVRIAIDFLEDNVEVK
jgi:hypothetical protein